MFLSVPFHHSHEHLHTGARDLDQRLHLLIKEVIKEVTAHTQALLWDNLEFIILPKATLTHWLHDAEIQPPILHSSISSLGTLHGHLYVDEILKPDVETGFKKSNEPRGQGYRWVCLGSWASEYKSYLEPLL